MGSRRDTAWTIAVWLVALVFAVGFSLVGCVRYWAFRAGVDDGIFTQIVASAGTGFHSTVEGDINHMAVHFSPILFLIAPLVWLTHSALALVVTQSVALALVGPPLFLIARRRMPAALAAAVACVVLAYPPLVALASGDFAELLLAPAATAWLLWALDARRWVAACLLALCALAIKEDELLVLAALAVALFVRAWRRHDVASGRFGIALFVAAMGLFCAYFAFLQPMAAPGTRYWSFHFYNWNFGDASPLGYAPVSSPLRAWYVWWAIVPLGGICLLSPAILLALPGLAEVMLSHETILINLSTHYVATWLPYVLLAYVLGVATIAARNVAAASTAVAICALLTIWTDVYANPSSLYHRPFRYPGAHERALNQVLDRVPLDASIGTSLNIYAHLGLYPSAGLGLTAARYVILDRRCESADCTNDTFPRADRLLATKSYRLLERLDGVELYELRRR